MDMEQCDECKLLQLHVKDFIVFNWLLYFVFYIYVLYACVLAGGVLNCDLSHRRSVAVLCMLYKIRCKPKHPLWGALPVPYVPVRVTHGALIAHLVYFCASPLRNLAVPHDFYFPLSLSLEWSGWPRILWCGIGGFQEQVQCLFVGLVAVSFFVFNYFIFLFFSSIGW